MTRDHNIAAVLAGFANNRGGTLILGVDDNATLLGLSKDQAKRAVSRIAGVAESLLPYQAGIGTVEIEGKRLESSQPSSVG